QVAARKLIAIGAAAQPPADLLRSFRRNAALLRLFGELRQRLLDRSESAIEEFLVSLEHHYIESRGGRGLGDARAHQSTAEHADLLDGHAKLSTTTAIPCPPPMHAVARPYRFLRRRSSYNSVMISRVPVAPSGCPSAMAPPFTLAFSRSMPNSFSTAKYCAAKASFTSIKSMSSS